MSSIFDVFDKNAINSTNLIDNGWKIGSSGGWQIRIDLSLDGGRKIGINFLFNPRNNAVLSIETREICKVSGMKGLRNFIDSQLDKIIIDKTIEYYENKREKHSNFSLFCYI